MTDDDPQLSLDEQDINTRLLFRLALLQPEVHSILRSVIVSTDDQDEREQCEHLLSEIEKILDRVLLVNKAITTW